MEWDKKNTLFLIQRIRERPVIWDVTLEAHKDKRKRLDALSEIGKILNRTKEEINSKWISLKGQYNREKRKVTRLNTGSGADDTYVSKWFAYQEMADLCNIPQDYISNNTMSAQPLTPPPSKPTSPPLRVKGWDTIKTKRNSSSYGDPLLTMKSIKGRKVKTPELEDEITTYGLYIAAQMRKFQPILQSKLKLDIQNLLYKYEIENMEYTIKSDSSMSDNSETS